jgi:chromosome segregation ATPase
MDKVKKLDETLKARVAEQKLARSRVAFKSIAELDAEVERLSKLVDRGDMKIVDEKKALAEVTSLHRQKKNFAGFDQTEKVIADIKAQIADLKKGNDNPEAKAHNERYEAARKELDDMRKDSDDAYKNVSTLRADRNKTHADQQEKFEKVKEIKDKFYAAKRAWRDWDQEQWKIRKEKQASERAAYESGKRKEVAQRKLEEASAPAYQDEIITAENLIRHFDPTSVAAKEVAAPGKFAAVAQRTVDDSGLKGTRVLKKDTDEESYFVGSGGKKGKKGKKPTGGVTSPPGKEAKFQLSIDVIEQLARIGIEPPMSQSHVSGVVTQIKEKLEQWKKDQDRKTKEVCDRFTVV